MMKLKIRFLLVFIVILSSCGLNSSVSKYPYKSKAQKKNLEKLFRNILFWEGGAYTLLGSKPITSFEVVDSRNIKEEIFNHFPSGLDIKIYINKDDERDLKFYHSLNSKNKQKVVLLPDNDYIFDIMPLWKDWEDLDRKVKKSKRYLLFKTEFSSDEEEGYYITLVNVLQTACLLKKHYELFKPLLGDNFDPIEETLNIIDPKSKLWKCLHPKNLQNHHQQVGLLLGFGYENSQIFHWKHSSLSRQDFFKEIQGISNSMHDEVCQKSHPFSSNNFPLPMFVTFLPNDPTWTKYSQEHEQIIAYYKDKDFLDATLDLLVEFSSTALSL